MSDQGRDERVSAGIQRVGFVAWSLLGTMLLLAAIGWVLLQVPDPAARGGARHRHRLRPQPGRHLAPEAGAGQVDGLLPLLPGRRRFADPARVPGDPVARRSGQELADDFPRIYDDLARWMSRTWSTTSGLTLDLPDYEKLRLDIEESGGDFFSEQFGRITDLTLSLLESLFLLLLAPVVAFYVLLDLPTLAARRWN